MTTTPGKQLEEKPRDPIRVMVIDDHAGVRSGLCLFLSTIPDIQVVGHAAGGSETLLYFKGISPHVVVLDPACGESAGIGFTEAIRKVDPSCGVVALTSFPDPEAERRALDAGAMQCLVKDVPVDALIEAIRNAYRAGCDGHTGRHEHMPFVQEQTDTTA